MLAGATAADSSLLDGLDSTAFLGASAKAADADKLDGLDSTAFLGAGGTATDSQLLDGLNSSDFAQHSARVVYLQGDGTDAANGSALVSAIAGITDEAVDKQYLVVLEPGTYDIGTQELVLPGFIHLRGSGTIATLITGSGTGAGAGSACATATYACVLQLDGLSEVRDVQVKNTGNSDSAYRIAVYSNGSGASLRNVHAHATGVPYSTAGNRADVLVQGNPPSIIDSVLQVSNAQMNHALSTIDTNGTAMRVTGSRLIAVGAGDTYYGIYASSTGPGADSTTIQLTDSYVTASGAGTSVDINDASSPTNVRVANTQLVEGDVIGAGVTTCLGGTVYDATFTTVVC